MSLSALRRAHEDDDYPRLRPRRCFECNRVGSHAYGCPAAPDDDEEEEPRTLADVMREEQENDE